MKKQYTVFLSSTFEDLKLHRRKIIDSLVKLQQNVQAMEFWAPSTSDSLELSLNKLKKSKIYIGLLGARYGTVAAGKKSITQLEYEEAVRLGLERQVYLIDERKHPVILKDVDTGDNAERLANFKKVVSSQSVRGKFSSPDDLAKQVITNLIELLKEEGEEIKAAVNGHGISNFLIRTGYSGALLEKNMNVSSLINIDNEGAFRFSNSYIESVVAAAVIAKNIRDGDFNFFNMLITFHPDVYRIACYLIRDLGVDDDMFADAVVKCEDSTTLRLLINIAGQAKVSKCIVPICDKILATKRYHNEVKSYGYPITPFNDIVKDALSTMPEDVAVPILKKYHDLARKQKRWHAKQVFEGALKNLLKNKGASAA